jgi:hypothetical protein
MLPCAVSEVMVKEDPTLTWCERGYADSGGMSVFASRALKMFFDSDIRLT